MNRTDRIRLTIVTNIPAPYRLPVYEQLSPFDFCAIFCAAKESNRNWTLPPLRFAHRILRGRVKARADGFNYVHNNPTVWPVLNDLRPGIVITTGFNPTHLYAFLWSRVHGIPHVCMTDGTLQSESRLSWKHRWLRRMVFAGSHAFIAASRSGMDLYRRYGISSEKIFQSHLCADNALFRSVADNEDRPYDVMFAGRFHEGKLPFFFVEICRELLARRGRCQVLLIGDGPLRNEVLGRLATAGIPYHYAGFVQQADLPAYYCRSRLLLFTTRTDTWGVVANEALAAGTPVITSPEAGVAGELVVDQVSGAVCLPEVGAWATAAARLLDDPQHWRACSQAGRERVAEYNYQAAAEGIAAACSFVMQRPVHAARSG